MDWTECIKKKIVKDITKDENLISSLKETAKEKIESADSLDDKYHSTKITIYYEALRENLEILAIKNNFKIYNHECYTPFLKEILNLNEEAELFDELRKIRNGINYYGKKITEEESQIIIENIKKLMEKIKL
jgi:hypothetical protein|tara:strand:- start:245 stop:640 length:396 start_codon:yes stop_codon:yes gene_type:complete